MLGVQSSAYWTNKCSVDGEMRGKCGGAQPINRPTAEPRLSTPRDCQKFATQVMGASSQTLEAAMAMSNTAEKLFTG
jgi:hypothetical protein